MASYSLYHTLNKKIKKTDLDSQEKKNLLKFLQNVKDEKKKAAIVMLIAEHAKLEGVLDVDNLKLPYCIKQTEDNVEIDLDKIPIPLKWILWKFSNI